MAQRFIMDSVESATINLLSGGGSNYNLPALKWRNNNVRAFNGTSPSHVPSIEIDFGTSTQINYFFLGNFIQSESLDSILFYYWNGSTYVEETLEVLPGYLTGPHDGNYLYPLYSSRTATKFKIVFTPDATDVFQLSNLFMGYGYFTTSTDYDYRSTRGSQFRGEVITDQYGNPYAHQINTTRKRIWDVVYRLSASELASFNTQFDKVGINQKAFYFLDERVSSTTWFLVKCENEALLPVQQSADLFELQLRLVQL